MLCQGLSSALGTSHPLSVHLCIVLALLLVQDGKLVEAAALCRFEGQIGPQQPQTLADARALVALLYACGEDSSAALLEQRLLWSAVLPFSPGRRKLSPAPSPSPPRVPFPSPLWAHACALPSSTLPTPPEVPALPQHSGTNVSRVLIFG